MKPAASPETEDVHPAYALLPAPPGWLKKGTEFPSKAALYDAIASWAIEAMFQPKLRDSNRFHTSFACARAAEGCPWIVRANCARHEEGIFRITKVIPHAPNCAPLADGDRNSAATVEWIKLRALPLLRLKDNVACGELSSAIKMAHGVDLPYHKIYRGLKLAKAELNGTPPPPKKKAKQSTGERKPREKKDAAPEAVLPTSAAMAEDMDEQTLLQLAALEAEAAANGEEEEDEPQLVHLMAAVPMAQPESPNRRVRQGIQVNRVPPATPPHMMIDPALR